MAGYIGIHCSKTAINPSVHTSINPLIHSPILSFIHGSFHPPTHVILPPTHLSTTQHHNDSTTHVCCCIIVFYYMPMQVLQLHKAAILYITIYNVGKLSFRKSIQCRLELSHRRVMVLHTAYITGNEYYL